MRSTFIGNIAQYIRRWLHNYHSPSLRQSPYHRIIRYSRHHSRMWSVQAAIAVAPVPVDQARTHHLMSQAKTNQKAVQRLQIKIRNRTIASPVTDWPLSRRRKTLKSLTIATILTNSSSNNNNSRQRQLTSPCSHHIPTATQQQVRPLFPTRQCYRLNS